MLDARSTACTHFHSQLFDHVATPQMPSSYEVKAIDPLSLSGPPHSLPANPVITQLEEPQVAGIILSMLPTLQNLASAAKHKGRVYDLILDGMHSDLCQNLNVVKSYGIQAADIPQVPAFANLRSLHTQDGHVDWALVILPSLQTLNLGEFVIVDLRPGVASVSKIRAIVFDAISTNQFGWFETSCSQRLLSNLRSLEFRSLSDPYYLFLSEGGWQRESVIHSLLDLAPGVEELHLIFGQDAFVCIFHGDEYRGAGFSAYTQLRKLVMSEAALMGDFKRFWSPDTAPIKFLPPQVKTLVITAATEKSADWLELICGTEFADMTRIELVAVTADWYDRHAVRAKSTAEQKWEETGFELVFTRPE